MSKNEFCSSTRVLEYLSSRVLASNRRLEEESSGKEEPHRAAVSIARQPPAPLTPSRHVVEYVEIEADTETQGGIVTGLRPDFEIDLGGVGRV